MTETDIITAIVAALMFGGFYVIGYHNGHKDGYARRKSEDDITR